MKRNRNVQHSALNSMVRTNGLWRVSDPLTNFKLNSASNRLQTSPQLFSHRHSMPHTEKPSFISPSSSPKRAIMYSRKDFRSSTNSPTHALLTTKHKFSVPDQSPQQHVKSVF